MERCSMNIIYVLAGIAISVVILVVIHGCAPQKNCIQPPPMSSNEQDQIAGAVALQLANVPVGGNVSANFSATLNQTYDKLDEPDKALFMYLTAIECYLKEGKVGEEIAGQMAQLVRDKYGAKAAMAPSTSRAVPFGTRSYAAQVNALLSKRNVKAIE